MLVAVRKGVYLTPPVTCQDIGLSVNFRHYLIDVYGDTLAVASPNKHFIKDLGGAVILIIV